MKTSFIVFLFQFVWVSPLFAQNFMVKQWALLQNTGVQQIGVENQIKWLCTGKGLIKLENETLNAVILQEDTLNFRGVSSIFIDSKRTKWIGNYQSQVFKLDSVGNKQVIDFQEFGSHLITSLSLDQEGKLWAGTFGGGVFSLDALGGKSRYQMENSKILSDQVFKILVDQQNRKWVGTAEGLCSIEGQKWRNYDLEGQITDILEYKGDLWVANATMQGSEIWRYQAFKRWERFPIPDELSRMRLMDLSFDEQGNLWVAGDKIAVWKNENWLFFGENEGFTSHSAFCVSPEPMGKVWVGTEGKGLFSVETVLSKPQIKSIDDLVGIKIPEEALLKPIPLRITFERGSADISILSKGELDKASQILQKNPDLFAEIAGHTDNVGDPNANKDLSEKRAFAVKQYLCVKNGVSNERIQAIGYGGTRPIADNSQESTRQLNRRVEITLRKK